MSSSAIARRYAKALVELGAEQNMVERFGSELSRVEEVLARENLLRLLLESPTIALEKKAGLLADLCRSLDLSPGVQKFLGLLLGKDRLANLPQIEENYRKFADGLSGIVRAKITSAAPLDGAQQEAIRASLEKRTGKKVELTVQLDPLLIGGIQAEVGGKVFDGSLRTQLNRIEDTLKKG